MCGAHGFQPNRNLHAGDAGIIASTTDLITLREDRKECVNAVSLSIVLSCSYDLIVVTLGALKHQPAGNIGISSRCEVWLQTSLQRGIHISSKLVEISP